MVLIYTYLGWYHFTTALTVFWYISFPSLILVQTFILLIQLPLAVQICSSMQYSNCLCNCKVVLVQWKNPCCVFAVKRREPFDLVQIIISFCYSIFDVIKKQTTRLLTATVHLILHSHDTLNAHCTALLRRYNDTSVGDEDDGDSVFSLLSVFSQTEI